MGIISRIKNDTKELTKMAKAVGMVHEQLESSEIINPTTYDWLTTAWICRTGIIEIIDRNNWPMTYKIGLTIQRRRIIITLSEAYMMSVGRLSYKTGQIDEELNDAVLNVLDKGDQFYKIDEVIPQEIKNIFI